MTQRTAHPHDPDGSVNESASEVEAKHGYLMGSIRTTLEHLPRYTLGFKWFGPLEQNQVDGNLVRFDELETLFNERLRVLDGRATRLIIETQFQLDYWRNSAEKAESCLCGYKAGEPLLWGAVIVLGVSLVAAIAKLHALGAL